MNEEPQLIQDIWDAILNDSWIWGVVWGPQRVGKTTVQMQCGFSVYNDWDKVLGSFVFNLSGFLYKMRNGLPERIWTRNKLHNRVPILLYDDFGGQSNKAEVRQDPVWDIFKGGFDLLGTQVAVLLGSMVDPAEPTFQIMTKYTHEIFVPERGVYKYDRVDWSQDFKGWRPRRSKKWVETNTFEKVPEDVYKQYDEMRLSLVDEVMQRMDDAMAETRMEYILKRLQPIDIDLLEILRQKSMVDYNFFRENEKYKDALIRCKARNLIVPIRKGKWYWYDLTNLGIELLEEIHKPTKQQKQQLQGIA